jgi:hypothetical protein
MISEKSSTLGTKGITSATPNTIPNWMLYASKKYPKLKISRQCLPHSMLPQLTHKKSKRAQTQITKKHGKREGFVRSSRRFVLQKDKA